MSACSLFLLTFGLTFVAATARAVVDEGLFPEAAVRDKLEQDYRAGQQKPDTVAERARRIAHAKLRADRILNLPADQVAAWAEGRLKESDLEKMPEPSPMAQTTTSAPTFPFYRLFRLVLTGVCVVVFGVIMRAQRRRDAPPLSSRKRS